MRYGCAIEAVDQVVWVCCRGGMVCYRGGMVCYRRGADIRYGMCYT